jgi:hypothetical protein
MWARRAIQSLEEVNGVGRSAHLSPGSREATEVVRLSKTFGLLSSLTTFVAVEHRTPAERNEGRPATRRVPVMLASGWGVIGRSLYRSLDRSVVAPGADSQPRRRSGSLLDELVRKPAPSSSPAAAPISRLRDSLDKGAPSFASGRPLGGLQKGALDQGRFRSPQQLAPIDNLSRLLQTQTAAGALGWDGAMERLAIEKVPGWGDLAERVEDAVSGQSVGHPDAAAAVATAKAMLILERGFAADRALWSRAAEKAVRFLAAAMNRPVADVTAWLASL